MEHVIQNGFHTNGHKGLSYGIMNSNINFFELFVTEINLFLKAEPINSVYRKC